MRPFRVHGQPTRSRVHWHVHKSSLSEEENKGDISETRTRDHNVTGRARYHCATLAARVENGVKYRCETSCAESKTKTKVRCILDFSTCVYICFHFGGKGQIWVQFRVTHIVKRVSSTKTNFLPYFVPEHIFVAHFVERTQNPMLCSTGFHVTYKYRKCLTTIC